MFVKSVTGIDGSLDCRIKIIRYKQDVNEYGSIEQNDRILNIN
jgi:hypothetical protein